MTRIDFHSNVPDKIGYTCRLARKVLQAGHQIVVLTQDQAQLKELDERLWSFAEQEFIPHVRLDDALANRTPLLLTADSAMESPHHDILINLSDTPPTHFARFARMLEVVSSEETDRQSGRQRYSFYKQRGYPLEHHVVDNA